MFETTLLDSARERRPVLHPAHWLISLAAGLGGFVAGSLLLPVGGDAAANEVLLIRSAVLGAAAMFYALSVCYTWTDARRSRLRAGRWAALVALANLPGFLIYLAYSAAKTGDWKRATVPMAYALEVLMVCAAALVPLIYTQALPSPLSVFRPVLPPRRGSGADRPIREQRPRQEAAPDVFTVPHEIPPQIGTSVPEPPRPPDLGGGSVPGLPNGLGGADGGVLSKLFPGNNFPPPPEQSKAAPARRVSQPSEIEAARAVFTPKPNYPPLALATRTQGTVKLHAIIGKDGTIQELRVISGPALLVRAAMEAVASWRYQPTLLNGQPVEVETEIDVKFILNN